MKLITFAIVLIILVASNAPAQVHAPASGAADGWRSDQYKDTKITGWTVRTNVAMEEHSSLLQRTNSALQLELDKIRTVAPPSALKALQEVVIWLEFNSRNHQPLQYHYSSDWLRNNGFDPRKESGIEIQAADYVNLNQDSLPLLYMLSLAYLHRELGQNNPSVLAAFQNAQTLSQYAGKNGFVFSSIAEYFACVSSAYLFGIPVAPFNRAGLKKIDPQGFAMVEKVWGIKPH
jgi:hypothetical protein